MLQNKLAAVKGQLLEMMFHQYLDMNTDVQGNKSIVDYSNFFEEIGVPTHHWMKHTGAVYKFANKFINWKTGDGETEYFSFNYTVPAREGWWYLT